MGGDFPVFFLVRRFSGAFSDHKRRVHNPLFFRRNFAVPKGKERPDKRLHGSGNVRGNLKAAGLQGVQNGNCRKVGACENRAWERLTAVNPAEHIRVGLLAAGPFRLSA